MNGMNPCLRCTLYYTVLWKTVTKYLTGVFGTDSEERVKIMRKDEVYKLDTYSFSTENKIIY